MEQGTEKKYRNATITFTLIGIICFLIGFVLLFNKPDAKEFNQVPIEINATEIMQSDVKPQNTESSSLGSVSVTAGTDVNLDLVKKEATLYFANPAQSTHNLMVVLEVDEKEVLKSGLIKPGFEINSLQLEDDVEMKDGKYDGKLIIWAYQPDTGERQYINSTIAVKVDVVNSKS